MAVNAIGRQSAEYLKSGKAKVYVQEIDEDNTPLAAPDDIGNVAEASLTVETETTDVRTGEDDNSVPVSSRTRITSARLTMTVRNHTEFLDTTSLQGTKTAYAQQAVAAGSFEFAGKVKPENTFKLDHEKVTVAVGAITDDGGNIFVLNEHYKIDRVQGFVKIIALPTGYTTGLNVSYTAEAYTTSQIGGFSRSTGKLFRVWIRETADGPRGLYILPRMRGTPDGDQGIIAADSDDPMEKQITFAIEQDQTLDANDGLFIYRKEDGSI